MQNILHSKNCSNSSGFSMIELIIVVMLIGIFTAMALTRTDTGLTTIREQIAIDQITNDIDLARSMAFARNEAITIIFDINQESYGVYNGLGIIKDFPNSNSDGIISLDNSYLRNLDIKEVSFGGSASLQFQPLGDPVSGGTIELNTKIITVEPITGKWSVN
jgi:prepilin-type N-terminal cleavage/methylation domain-containing protein